MKLVDKEALYNGAMKDEYFDFVAHDNHGRESFAYSCAMQRLAEAPTIDAIPMEWMGQKRRSLTHDAICGFGGTNIEEILAINTVLDMWKNEQGVEHGKI